MTIAELAAWFEDHNTHETRPLELVWGTVETLSGVEAVEDGGPVYEPSGYTEILWDTQTTVGIVCDTCGEQAVSEDLLSNVIGNTRTHT